MKRSRKRIPRRKRENRWVDPPRGESRRPGARRIVRSVVITALLAIAGYHGIRVVHGHGWLSPFEIREVRVVGADVVHPAVLVAEAGLNGERLHLWSDLDAHVTAVLRDPMLVAAHFERRFPNRLTLVVEERRPIALIQLERLTPVDAAGLVLPVSAFHGGWDVPVMTVDWDRDEIVGSGRVRVGAVRHALTWLAAVEDRLPALYGGISTVALDTRGGIALRVDTPECVVLLDEQTSIDKLSLLDDVLRDLETKGQPYSEIDLRFEDQIVVRRE